jgi:hypothetical protein
MLKIFKALSLVIFVLINTLLVSPLTSNAYGTFNSHVLTGGVGNWGNDREYYWLHSTAVPLRATISEAMSNWVNTSHIVSTPISFRETTNQPSSVIDTYYSFYYDPSQGIAGETVFFTGSTKIDPSNSNWSWTEVRLNAPTFQNLSAYNKKGTVAHEFGHAFGLAHQNFNPNVIMCQLGSGRAVNTPQGDDLNGINALY